MATGGARRSPRRSPYSHFTETAPQPRFENLLLRSHASSWLNDALQTRSSANLHCNLPQSDERPTGLMACRYISIRRSPSATLTCHLSDLFLAMTRVGLLCPAPNSTLRLETLLEVDAPSVLIGTAPKVKDVTPTD